MRPTTSSRSSRLLQIATIMLALAASACGGGGGGGTVTPPGGGGGGGGPTPTPAPTGSPGATPTPAHTATPGPTPTPGHTATPGPTPTPVQSATPTPTSPPTGNTFLPDTTGRFGLIQVLDQYGRGQLALSPGQIAAEAPHYDSVWGAFQPSTWRGSNARIILSRYYMPFEDNSLVSGNTLSYFQSNHPEWILYGCDNNNNPTNHYAWTGTGFNDTPLDIHNPAVVAYQMGTIVNYLRANGYNALAIDNITFVNYLLSPNEILERQPAQHNWYGCGVYQNGTFIRRYTTGFDQPDPQFTADLENWVHQAQIALAPFGLKVIVNHPPSGSSPNADEQQLLGYIDGLLDENGYTHYGTLLTGTAFSNTLSWTQLLQARGKAALITDYFCTGAGCSNDPSTLTPQQADWALASYALGNNGGEDVYISPHGGAVPSFRQEYTTRYGNACGAFTQSSNVYTRRFSGGFAVVNASGSATAVQLPNHAYSDIEGRPISNPLTVNPTDAFMLITSGNGCS